MGTASIARILRCPSKQLNKPARFFLDPSRYLKIIAALCTRGAALFQAAGFHPLHLPQQGFLPLPYGTDCTLAILAKAVISTAGIKRVSFLPMTMDSQYHTEVLKLKAGDPRFDKVV